MAQLGIPPSSFEDTEANRDISADPAFTGWHPMQIVESESKIAKSGNGEITVLTAQVIDGPFKGRKLWINLNLSHANQQAEEIAWRELKAICAAVGLSTWPKDTVELHNLPFLGNVRYKPEEGTYKARNEVASGGFKPIGSTTPAPSPAPSGGPAPAGNARPWLNRRAG